MVKKPTKKPIRKKINTYPEPPQKSKEIVRARPKAVELPRPKSVVVYKPKYNYTTPSPTTKGLASRLGKNAIKLINPFAKASMAAKAATVVGTYMAASTATGLAKGYSSSSAKKTTASKPKTNNSMTVSRARQEVAQAKRVQATQQKTSTGTTKKVGAKATAHRQTRHWGASKTATELAKKNKSRTRS